jgi:hypothetical protein
LVLVALVVLTEAAALEVEMLEVVHFFLELEVVLQPHHLVVEEAVLVALLEMNRV